MDRLLFAAPGTAAEGDFNWLSTGNSQKTVALKFVEMDPFAFSTCGDGSQPCDSAFGATAVPEPNGLALLGLIALAALARRRATP
ncbi:MAG: PEP-CTERM sorting domain-containing protein [Deltaproteobacteria bacterium]|nr:PEP-CTERM sorting domain-containing protein [Deltaproteobacteria bacterium]